MGLKEVYSAIETKYYNFMDAIDEKGIPVYKAIDFVESKSIPSFPLAVIFFVLILSGLILTLNGGSLLQNTTEFELMITDGTTAIQGTTISYFLGEKQITVTTNNQGKAVIEVTQGKEFSVTAEKNGFKKITKTFDAKDEKATLVLIADILKPIKIQLLGKGNELLEEEIKVSFTCSENDKWNEIVLFNTGTTNLADVPANCGKILAEPIGKKCSDCDFDAYDSLIKIYLEETTTEKGTINFTVLDDKGNYAEAIQVMVIPTGNLKEEDSCYTFNGLCETEVPFGTYYIRATDSTGKLRDYDSRKDTITITLNSNNQNIDFEEIILGQGVIGQIKIKIKSETGNLIEDALVRLFKDNSEINQQRSNTEGEIIFNVAEQIDYTVSVTHANYLNSDVKTVSPKNDFYSFSLKEATSSNKRKIEVNVVDEKNEAVENTKVFLKDALTGSIVGQEKVTGLDGKASFERLPTGKYILRAEKRGFEGKDSRVIEVKENELNEVTIKLDLGQGNLDVIVIDKEKQPIQSATIKVIDYFTGKEIFVDSTDTEGKKSFNIRADKKVYLEVNESSHSNYISAPIQMFNGTEEKTILLEDSINSFAIKLEELSLEGQEVENITVSEGRTYKAKFKLMIPTNVFSNNAGVHIRTGADTKNQNNTMEKDDLYIKKVIASNAKIIKGTAFNPNTGYAIDSKHLTSGNAKWTNIIFNSVKEGTYEVEIVIQVRETLNGSPMELAYRAWIENNGYQRDPYDSELQEAESSALKQALYAKTRHEPLKIGASSLCAENFCSSFTIKDLQNAVRTNIIDSFPAEISSNYELEFNIISTSEKTYSNSELIIKGKGIELNSYEIQGTQKNAEGEIIVKTGLIEKGQKISGTINFTTKKEGTNRIDLSLFGESSTLGKEKILFKPIRAEVKHAKTMIVSNSPQNLVPFIKNNLLVRITDEEENELSEVEIKIEKDFELIASGKTDSKGIFAFGFEAMNPGTKIIITAEKYGFNSVEKEMKIQENIIDVSPPEINESFNAKQDYAVTRDITLKNTTEMPLTVIGAELTDSFRGMIESEITGTGKELTIGNSESILIKLEMTNKGKNIKTLTSLSGEVVLILENLEAGKQWTASVPVKITIGLGGEVDSADCFSLSPNSWTALTENKTKEIKLNLANNCTVKEENISLKDVKAKVVWKENAIGTFELTSGIDGTKTTTLTNNYKTLNETFNPNTGEEENLTLIFTPDEIALGSGTATIYLEAVNPTEKGNQKLIQKIEVQTEISKLSECLRIRPASNQIRIQMNSYNYGYGSMPNYFGYTPQNNYYYGMNPNYLSSGNRNYPFTNYPYDPNASAGSLRNNPNVVFPDGWRSQQYPHNYYNTTYSNPTGFNPNLNNAWNTGSLGAPGKATIDIENSCASTVQVELEGTPEISVSDRTIVLEKGNHKTIEITPTMFIGQYPLTIRAKHKSSTDSAFEIAKYNVLVESEFERNYYDCINLSKRVFTFNDVIQKPVEGMVWNTCYDTGIRLNYQSIPRNLSGIGNFNFPSPQDTGQKRLGSSGMISSIELIQLVNKPGAEGKIIQELKFRMRKNLGYRTGKIPQLPNQNNPLIELANLRIKLTGAYYTIEAEERLPITFFDRTGNTQVIPFDIIIEDLWAGLPIIAEEIEFGNPNAAHQECIDESALQFSDCIADELFIDGVSRYIDARKVIRKGKEFCGDSDRIARLINSEIKDDSGITLKFEVKDGDKIQVIIDKTKMKYNPGRIEGKLYARLSRVSPLETKTVEIPFSIEVCELAEKQEKCFDKIKDKEEITKDLIDEQCPDLSEDEKQGIIDKTKETEEIQLCENGFTGETAFKEYGLDKIKLNWEWNSIEENECDAENNNSIYCDAVQFAIELNKKAKNIRNLGVIAGDCTGYCEQTDSLNLFRFIIAKTKVKDDITKELQYFFLDSSNSIIAGKKFDGTEFKTEINTIKEALETDLTNSKAKTITQVVNTIIDAVKTDSAIDETAIIGEIKLGNMLPGKLEAIGAERIISTKYVMTFNEYKALRDQLKTCTDTNPTAKECEINKVSGLTGKIFIDKDFLKELQNNIEFKVGIRNTASITLTERNTVIKQGKVTASKLVGTSFEDFYNKNIEFISLLKEDGISPEFKEDFTKEYATKEVDSGFREWTFNKTKFDSGTYLVKFNYDWAAEGKNTEVKLEHDGDLSSVYKKNYLFSVPFDGKVGITDSTKRKGYGTGYGNNKTVNNIYLNKNILLKDGDGLNTGLNQFNNTEKAEEFKDTRNGKILYMTNGELKFTPSKPLGLTAELDSGKSGVFYDLTKTAKAIGIDQETTLNYLFKWNSVKDEKQEESNLKKATDCQATRFGIIFNDEEIQKVLSFIPVNWGYKFEKYCNNGIKTMTGYDFSYKGIVEKHDLPGTASFSSDVEGNIEQKTSIKKWIDDIKTENICFTTNNNEFTLEWNKEKLMKEMN